MYVYCTYYIHASVYLSNTYTYGNKSLFSTRLYLFPTFHHPHRVVECREHLYVP